MRIYSFFIGVSFTILAACSSLYPVPKASKQPNQVYQSQPLEPYYTEGYEQEDDGSAVDHTAPTLAILLENEFKYRRQPQSIDFDACRETAAQHASYELTLYCLAQARNLRDSTSDITLAQQLITLKPNDPQSYNQLAESYINAEQYVAALEVLNQSDDLGFAPDFAIPAIEAVFLYGDDILGLAQSYNSLFENKPHRERLLFGEILLLVRRMEQLYFTGQYNRALEAIDELLALVNQEEAQPTEIYKDFPFEKVRIIQARSLRELGLQSKAIQTLTTVVVRYPQFVAAQVELFEMYLQAAQYSKADSLAIQMLKKHSQRDAIILRIGLLAVKHPVQRTRALVQYYFQRKAESSTVAERELGLWHLSQLAKASKQVQQQLLYLQGIQTIDELVLAAIREKAHIIEQEQGMLAAEAFFVEQRAAYPPLAFNIQRAQAYWLSNHDMPKAIAFASDLLQQHGNREELLFMRGFFYALEGNVAAMEEDFVTILMVDPRHVDTLNAYGYTLVDLTPRIDEGLALIERAFALDSERPAIVDSLAWAFFRKGDARRALVLIQWAYSRDQDPEIAAHYGEILWTLGYTTEARALLERDRKNHPDNSVIQETWQRLFSE